MPAIKTSELTKTFGEKTAVASVDLEIREGELFSVLGVNGAGKTTLLRMLSCLCTPSSGEAWVCGHSILRESESVRSCINISPQETAVAPNLTVRENLELIAQIYDLPDKKTRTEEIISLFSLEEVSGQRAKTLSGGWQRRLSIAMALISRPKVLFLDEPTLGLDVLARRMLWQIIEEIKQHTTVILTTHYLEEAEALSDRIAILQQGRLKAVGTPEELISMSKAKNFEDAFITLAGGTQS